MTTLVLALSGVLLAGMVIIGFYNLCTALRLDDFGRPGTTPRVSLLIPARDEADNLRDTLDALVATDYDDLEILVLDDRSGDATAAVVAARASASRGRLRLLHGAPLPTGWVGKNWACHQLAAHARGDILIFCDADVRPHPAAVVRTVAALERTGAGALTAFPRQRLGGWAERAVVPLVMHLPITCGVPLRRVLRSPSPALTAANGQWFAFRRAVYADIGGHAAVRDAVVEDMALARRVKARGHTLLPVVARSLLTVRMYRSLAAVWRGFHKNLYLLAGGRPVPFLCVLGMFSLVAVAPLVAAGAAAPTAGIVVSLLVVVRLQALLLFRHGIASVVLHPVGALLLTIKSEMLCKIAPVGWRV